MIRCVSLSLAASLVAGLAIPVHAQGGAIRSGNVHYKVMGIPDSITSGEATAEFTARISQDPNALAQHWWYYRIAGDTREFPFNTGDTNNDGQNTQGFAEFYNGDTAALVWTDVDERGQLSATWRIRVISTGGNKGVAVSQMTITNISNAPITVDTFALSRWDLCLVNDPHVNITGTGFHQHITPDYPSQCAITYFCEWLAIGADHWEIADRDYQSLRLRFIDNAITTLTDSTLPWSASNHCDEAFHWQGRTLQSGQSETFTALFAHNYTPCAQEATAVNYGQGSNGTNGIPALTSVNPPIIGGRRSAQGDARAKMRVTNGLANANGSLLAGLSRTNIVFGNVTLYTQSIADIPLALDATGQATVVLDIPLIPTLCGFKFDFQALLLDPGAGGPFPVAHTGGLEWTLGGY